MSHFSLSPYTLIKGSQCKSATASRHIPGSDHGMTTAPAFSVYSVSQVLVHSILSSKEKTPQFPSGSDKGFSLCHNYQQQDVSGSLCCAAFKSHAVAARLLHNVTAVCTYREKRLADPILTPYIFKSAGGLLAHFRPIWTLRPIVGLCPTYVVPAR